MSSALPSALKISPPVPALTMHPGFCWALHSSCVWGVLNLRVHPLKDGCTVPLTENQPLKRTMALFFFCISDTVPYPQSSDFTQAVSLSILQQDFAITFIKLVLKCN